MSTIESYFPAHPQQAARLVGAHQRQIVPITSPVAIRHLALWQGYDVAKAETSQSRFGPEDRYIAGFYRHLIALRARKKIEFRFPSGFVWPDARADVGGRDTIQLFNSHISANKGLEIPATAETGLEGAPWRTIRFDLVWNGLPITVTFDSHVEHLLITSYAHLNEIHEPGEHWQAADPLLKARCGIKAVDGAICDFVYRQLWNDIDKTILPKNINENIGRIIADSRGLVVRPQVPQPHPEAPILGRSEAALLRDLWPHVYPHAGTGLEAARTEFTVSAMMGRRALHATSLGHQSLIGGDRLPMRYIIAENLDNGFQRGRLLYRINRAGIARICATMHWEHLNEIGKHLRAAEAELPEGLFASAGKPPEPAEPSTQPLLERMRSAVRNYVLPTTTNDLKHVQDHREQAQLRSIISRCEAHLKDIHGKDIGGGPAYRSERSRQYVEEFNRVVQDLRLSRVDGYQRYDEYVRQRLGTAFDYIGMIGDRYLRVQTGVAQMRDRQRSYETMNIAHGIDRAQDTADIALFAIIGPYYASNVLLKLFHPEEGGAAYDAIWIGVFLFGTLVALRNWSHRNQLGMKDSFRKARMPHLIWLLLAFWLAGGWIGTHFLQSAAGVIAAMLTFTH